MKTVFASQEEIPEAIRGEYELRDGKYVLKLDGEIPGHVPAARLEEFRTNNRALNSLKDELERKLKSFEGIDPKEYAALKTKIAELEKAPADVQARIDAAVAAVVTPLRQTVTDLQQKTAAAEEARNAAIAAAQRKDLESALQGVGLKLGVDERALPDYLRRGLEVFQIVDGKPVARSGDTPLLSKNGSPLTPEQWAAELAADAPHLFKPSKGGGAAPGPGGSTSGAVRIIGQGMRLSAQDVDDLATGKAVREAVAS